MSANTVPGTTSPYYRSSIDPPKPSLDALLVDVPADVPADVLLQRGALTASSSLSTEDDTPFGNERRVNGSDAYQ